MAIKLINGVSAVSMVRPSVLSPTKVRPIPKCAVKRPTSAALSQLGSIGVQRALAMENRPKIVKSISMPMYDFRRPQVAAMSSVSAAMAIKGAAAAKHSFKTAPARTRPLYTPESFKLPEAASVEAAAREGSALPSDIVAANTGGGGGGTYGGGYKASGKGEKADIPDLTVREMESPAKKAGLPIWMLVAGGLGLYLLLK